MSKTKKTKNPASRITSISISRLYNLGNYQNIKYDLSAEVGPGESASEIFKELHFILSSLRPLARPHCLDDYERAVKKPTSEQGEYEKAHLQEWAEDIATYNERKRRRDQSVLKLNELGGSSFWKDAKANWETDDEPF